MSVTTANKSSENEKLKEYYQMKIRKIKKRVVWRKLL